MNESAGSHVAVPASVQGRPRRVCLVTTEFHGLFRNGGIGTANTGLALALASAGFDVTVAFADADANGPRLKMGNFAELKAQYLGRGVTLDWVPPHPLVPNAFDDSRWASYCVFLYVQRGGFDLVLFNDNGGHGFYALLAKSTGVFENPPMMCVVAHGPHEWVHELNALEYYDRRPVAIAYQERRSVALADVLVSPSRYLVEWMSNRAWTMPRRHRVIQNIVGVPNPIVNNTGEPRRREITEIVFFGRQETRKGLELFCDALDLLHRTTDLGSVTVTFLGKFCHIGGLHSGVYLAERGRRWRPSLRILDAYDQAAALDYLRQPGVLAVIPSLAENSPCVVLECLQLGVPFVATDSGGTAELIAPEDCASCLFAPSATALAVRLEEALCHGQRPARLRIAQADIVKDWLGMMAENTDRQTPPRGPSHPGDPPLVSVCLVHAVASTRSDLCLASVMRQTYPRLEVVIVKVDGRDQTTRPAIVGDEPAAILLHVVDAEGLGRGAARNLAAQHAHGDYLLFVDEAATTLLDDGIEILVAAARHTGAEVLTGMPTIGSDSAMTTRRHDRPPMLPIGGCVELGAFENCFGEAVLLVKADSFRDGRGFATDCDDAILDWLFLATSVQRRVVLEVIPRPVYRNWPRQDVRFEGVGAVRNHRRILQAYQDSPLSTFAHIVEPLFEVDRQHQGRLWSELHGTGQAARDIALRLASLEPSSEAASRAFVEYCLERRMVALALDFALHNKVPLLSEAVEGARNVTETLVREAIGQRQLGFRHRIDLSNEVRDRARAVVTLRPEDLLRPPAAAIAHPLWSGVCIVKAAAACPPGAETIHGIVSLGPTDVAAVQFAIAVCRPQSRLVLSQSGLASGSMASWSGWAGYTAPGDPCEVTVRIKEPAAQLLDIFLLSRHAEPGAWPQTTVTWASVAATVSVNGDTSPSAIELETIGTPIPPDVLSAGVLLTDLSGFPFPAFVPGHSTMLHPLPGRIALARLAEAIHPGVHGVRSVVSVDHAQAGPVEFAVWIRPSAAAPLTEAELADADGGSGWFAVHHPFVHHHFVATLPAPAIETMDLYLATRAVSRATVDYCHAYWHELATLTHPNGGKYPSDVQ